ncbi:MAG: hypothetical protein CMB21_00455 [Euryarchaeota archaeon]|nr:hypothetical protein [Euryarchaeota archaeon]
MASKIFGMLDGYIGAPSGIVLLGLSLILMLQGHRRIKMITIIAGAGIGYYVSGLAYEHFGFLINSQYEISQEDFQTLVTIFCAGLLFTVVNLASIFITAAISLYIMVTLVEFLEGSGYDVGGELEGGIVTIIAILLNRLLRKNLYLVGSAAIGSLLGIVGYLLLVGTPPSEMELSVYPLNAIVLALFLNSLLIQKLDQRKTKEKKKIKQLVKKSEREPISFMEEDILASAYQEEREYRSMEAYNNPGYY